MHDRQYPVHGAGLGLRRALMAPLAQGGSDRPDFLEVAPENWIGIGGARAKRFRALTEQYPFVSHGLSLSLGGPAPLDEAFLVQVRDFLDAFGIRYYSEHLSYCGDDGALYDLLPIPFTEEAVDYVSRRIRRAQDILGRRIAVENVSCYATPGAEMSEIDFVCAVLDEADCELLLDVNNIFVNSINFSYDPIEFLDRIPGERIAYAHIAGHHEEDDGLRIDTHGSDVIDPVWGLLQQAYRRFGVFPTVLERDFNFPPLPVLLQEVSRIKAIQAQAQGTATAGAGGR
ncbi:DUF692 domain-containing protein [Methylonatrum kenyense]|uniref:HvfB family MNIO-type RiPP peptide maturase n=1 Tax=Methylonatrum kenyense TaxID=455253 RepID=UPI0020BE678D|nr:DUF692 domain-containing protein [Methylonatrum kenyense]MCK8515165.1 DUF692 domain-containing protein [Methylonatrum kenyense]